ncbi:MAG TPA: hypothetical protein VHV10_20135 [Ktedonobacteraceae bacterium]|jgi:hypothetical protein|nr:hypothetical protein [Ktedonobacteraceae bacterium]
MNHEDYLTFLERRRKLSNSHLYPDELLTVPLEAFLEDVTYEVIEPTVLKITFTEDEEDHKLWCMYYMLSVLFRAYGTGPAKCGCYGTLGPDYQSYGFRSQDDLERARSIFHFPEGFIAGPPIYIGPQP